MRQTVKTEFKQMDECGNIIGIFCINANVDTAGVFEQWASSEVFRTMLHSIEEVLDTCELGVQPVFGKEGK